MQLDNFLTEDEETLAQAGNVHLTNQRLIQFNSGKGYNEFEDMSLDDIHTLSFTERGHKDLAFKAGMGSIACFGAGFFALKFMSGLSMPLFSASVLLLGLAAFLFQKKKQKGVIQSKHNKFKIEDDMNVLELFRNIRSESI